MPGDRITIATVPDEGTANLLEEVLRDGGIESVELEAIPGNPYLGRSHTLDYEVRVSDVDEANARKVLADFEEASGQAATSQSAIPPAEDEAPPADSIRQRKPWVIWGLAALALSMFAPIIITLVRWIFQSLF